MRDLYGSTRAEELERFPFSDEQKQAFIAQQFAAQTAHYEQYYPTVVRSIVELDGRPVGRFWVDHWRQEIRIVDIALIDDVRGRGIGTVLLEEVLDTARAAGKPVTIHVESFNPALRLYERLGFRHVDTNGVYHLMKWTAA
jgi:GNAT superfamily N-acetyltransferase